jgi:hypothetical protein
MNIFDVLEWVCKITIYVLMFQGIRSYFPKMDEVTILLTGMLLIIAYRMLGQAD